MKKYPMTLREILQEISTNQEYSMDDKLFFLQEIICLFEDYDGLAESLAYICNEWKKDTSGQYKEYLPLTEIFSKLCIDGRERLLTEEQQELKFVLQNFTEAQAEYLSVEDDFAVIKRIAEEAYYCNESVVHTVAAILSAELSSRPLTGDIGQQVMNQQNIGFLIEMLSERGNTFTIICDGNGEVNWDVLGNMVSRLGHKVIMAVKTSDKNIDTEYCIKHMERYEDVSFLMYTEDNLEDIVKYVCHKESGDGLSCVIASGSIWDRLMLRMERGCEAERLSLMKSPVLQDKLTFGWAGDYLSYVSKIYQCDAHKDLQASPQYRFSIVIPTKNSAKTLRYTLMTCMNQRWQGNFEILVSDNSSEGNEEIYHLCKELAEKDERIRYIRTPRPLVIGKSFEYAFLKSRGEFIIPLGADDGALPWTLQILDKILEDIPDEIIMWNRGQYQWPDYGAGISDRLEIFCGAMGEEKYSVSQIEGMYFLKNILEQPQRMYLMPLLYINSGFRRTYMRTLLEKTGRLWDGPCQDIFMGIVNSAINEKISYVSVPLSLAGMAHSSTGATYTRLLDTLEKVNKRGRNKELGENSYIGGWSSSPIERFVPRITSDIGLCYNSLIRAIAKKVLPMETVNPYIDIRRWFVFLYKLMNKREYIYERQVMEMKYAARLNGQEFYQWFQEDFWQELIKEDNSKSKEQKVEEVKTYKTEVCANGNVIIDASQYGVENIYQAALLAEKISEY